MEIKELADNVILLTSEMQQSKTGNYYMTNINHPIIASLKRRYCKKNNINQTLPLSDQQRIEFELWLFQPSVRKIVENICTKHITKK